MHDESTAAAIDRGALALYVSCGGDPQAYPWPTNNAEAYRRKVRAVLAAVDSGRPATTHECGPATCGFATFEQRMAIRELLDPD